MKPRYDDGFCRMYVGDAIDVLSQLPEKSIHCCVASPPYFGLRSYLPSDHPDKAREGGTQETPEQYVQWLVDVFRGVWRVLRDDGTLWLNLGDSYASTPTGSNTQFSGLEGGKTTQVEGGKRQNKVVGGYKPKDLLMIPARVALALQSDGWFLRSQIVWCKNNPMPESVTDRPTQATEMVYLLTKKPRYFYDAEAVKEPIKPGTISHNARYELRLKKGLDASRGGNEAMGYFAPGTGRNLRNYWQISTRPYPGSHYATFPPELPLRCIKAGTSEHGVCSECGAPWRRVVERGTPARDWRETDTPRVMRNGSSQRSEGLPPNVQEQSRPSRTIGFEPTCSHDASEAPIPATVLDPFSGSGTTGLVARKLGRRSILVDLDERNVRLLEQRMGYQGVLL